MTLTVSGGSNSWSKDDQVITINASDSQSGVDEKWYKVVSNTEEIPTEGLTKLTGNTITVSDEGKYYIYYKIYDNAGDTETGREANKTEGFKLVQIDKTTPEITFGEYSAGSGMTVTVKDGEDGTGLSGLASVTYKIENSEETLKTENISVSGKTNVSFTLTEIPAGDIRITVTAVDNVGNSFVSYKDIHVDIVSVDITWGDMEFTYSDGTWNAETHTYEGVGWSPDKTDGNKITVQNSGDVEVSVSYRYTQTKSQVSGGFTDGEAVITAPVVLPAVEKKSAWLSLNGKPTESMEKSVLGSVRNYRNSSNLECDDKKENKKKWLLLLLLLLITIAAVGLSVWAIWFRDGDAILAPDYAPQQVEENAEPIGDDGEEKLSQPEGGGAVGLTYAKEVDISLSDKKATLLFANPTKSNQDMVLQLVIDDVVILQSGRLEPGNRVSALNLLDGAEKKLAAGGYDGKIVVLYYDRTSGEKAMVNTEIPVTVTVTE